MKRLQVALICICLIALLFPIIELGLFVKECRRMTVEISTAITEINGAAKEIRAYSQEQISRLRDPRNSAAIDAAIQSAAVFNATGRLINKVLVPKAAIAIDGLSDSMASLNKMIQSTDRSINQGISPEAERSMQSLQAVLNTMALSIQDVSVRANVSLDDIHVLLNNPVWLSTMNDINSTTSHIDGIAGQLEDSSKQMPSIAASLERIAKTSSKYQRFVILSQILSAIGRAFF